MFKRVINLLNSDHSLRVTTSQTINTKGLKNTGINCELIEIHHGANGVKMHVSIAVGDFNSVNGIDLRIPRSPEQILCNLLNRSRLSSLANSNSQGMSVNVKHITALDMPGLLMVVPNRSPCIFGMVFENRFIEGHFTISLFPIHMVKQNAFAHGSKRIAREI